MADQDNIQDGDGGNPPFPGMGKGTPSAPEVVLPPVDTGHRQFNALGQANPIVEKQPDEPQTTQPQEPPTPDKKLYDYLSANKLYTKSYGDFKTQFNNPQSIDKLYGYLGQDNTKLYTKSKEEFTNQFFNHLPEKEVADAQNFVSGILKTPAGNKAIDKLTGDQFYNNYYQQQQSEGKDQTRIQQPLPIRLPDHIVADREDFNQAVNQNPDLARKAINEIKRQNMDNPLIGSMTPKDPTLNKNIDKAVAIIDVTSRPHDPERLKHQLDQIDKGELTYDAETKQFVKPVGFGKMLVNTFKKNREDLADYDYLTSHNTDDNIKYLESKSANYDPDKPVERSSGFWGDVGSQIGGGGEAMLKLGAGSVATRIAGATAPELTVPLAGITALGVGMGAMDFHHVAWKNTLEQTYRDLKQKHPNEDPQTLYDEATKQANVSGTLAMGQALLLGGEKSPEFTPVRYSTSAKKAFTDIVKNHGELLKSIAPEAVKQGTVAGAIQAIENISQGKSAFDNVYEAGKGMAGFTLGLGLLRGEPGAWTKAGRENTVKFYSEAPEQLVDHSLNTLVQSGNMSTKDAIATKSEITNHKKMNENMPDVNSLTPEAEQLLESVKDGGVPAFMTKNLMKIAGDNGIKPEKTAEGTDKELTPNDVIAKLQKLKNSVKHPPTFKTDDETAGLSDLMKKNYEKDPDEFLKEVAAHAHGGVMFEGKWQSSFAGAVKEYGEALVKKAIDKFPEHYIQGEKIPEKEAEAVKPENKGVGLSKNTFTHTQTTDDLKGVINTNDDANPEIKNDILTAEGKKDAVSTDMRGYKQIYVSPNDRTVEMADLAQKDPDAKVQQLDLLRTLDVPSNIERKMESDVPEESLLNTKEGTAFKKQMEDLAAFKKDHPDAAYVTHNKVDRAQAALEKTDGKWTDETTKEYLRLGDEEKGQKPEPDNTEPINKLNSARQKELNSATKPAIVKEKIGSDEIAKAFESKYGGKISSGTLLKKISERDNLMKRYDELTKAIPCLWK